MLEVILLFKTDPGIGVIRHADAGYEQAISFAKNHNIKIPLLRG